jgi:hypothetical protein
MMVHDCLPVVVGEHMLGFSAPPGCLPVVNSPLLTETVPAISLLPGTSSEVGGSSKGGVLDGTGLVLERRVR